MDNYQLNEEIVKGQYSTAYKGRRRRTTNFYAILSTDKCRRQRVLNSVHILRALQHPCVIKFYNWFETNNHLWVISEYCAGGDLATILKDTVISEVSLRALGRDVATGLMHFHSMGYLYNDLKPDNLLMDCIPSLRYYDFGNSCLLSAAGQRNLVGTPVYMAPELFSPQQGVISMAADLWSLGCVLYEMATGAPPFVGNDLPTLLRNILVEPAPTAQGMSSEFNLLIGGLLQKDPRKRFTWSDVAASEFWEELLALPINEFPPEPLFAKYIMDPPRVSTKEALNQAIAAAVDAASENFTGQPRRSEDTFHTKAIIFEELNFTPAPESPKADDAAKPVATAAPRRETMDNSSDHNKQAQLSKTDRASALQRARGEGNPGRAVNPERSGSAGLVRGKSDSIVKVDVEEVCLVASTTAIRDHIWHTSDTHIRPLCMNGRIERYVEPTVAVDRLPFSYHSIEVLKQLGHDGLNKFFSNAYRTLSSEMDYTVCCNILAYFEVISKDATIANILINSATLDYCYRVVESNGSTQDLRAQAVMVIGQLARHTTFIHQDLVRAGIIQLTMSLYSKETKSVVRRRLLMCLGELLFYVSVQTAAEREGWGIQADAVEKVYLSALDSSDDVLKHYAIKGIENVASVSDRFVALKLFATPAIAERLLTVYRGDQRGQTKGEHMRSSAICAACKLASASDTLLTFVLQSPIFPLSEYPNAIRRTHIPLTAQLLLTLLVYALHRFIELIQKAGSPPYAANEAPKVAEWKALVKSLVEISESTISSVKEFSDKSTVAMRGKCLLFMTLIVSLGGSAFDGLCSSSLPTLMDRLLSESDTYVQQCAIPLVAALNSFILGKMKLMRDETNNQTSFRALRCILASSSVRKELALDPECFRYLADCLTLCVKTTGTSYEEELHNIVECFFAAELVRKCLAALCTHLIPPLLAMVEVKNNSSRFFAVRLLCTFTASLLAERAPTEAADNGPPAAMEAMQGITASVANVLPELLKEPQPVPSHTIRLLSACNEWSTSLLSPLSTAGNVSLLIDLLRSPQCADKVRPLLLLQSIVSQSHTLLLAAFEHSIVRVLLDLIGLTEEHLKEAVCSACATMFSIPLLDIIQKQVTSFNPEHLKSLTQSLLSCCTEDTIAAKMAANAVEGVCHVSPSAQQSLLGTAGQETMMRLMQRNPVSADTEEVILPLLRGMRRALHMSSSFLKGNESGLLLRMVEQADGREWTRPVRDELERLKKELHQ